MLRHEFLHFANETICKRVGHCSQRSYQKMMCYCENTFRECVGFIDLPIEHDRVLAELICTGVVNAYIAGVEEGEYKDETNC